VVRKKWGKLTDDDVDVIAGKRDILLGKIQERHGIAREEAEKELKAWEDSLKELRRVHHYSRSHGPS